MSDDPRKAETLDEAARNPDGTYDGYRAMSWMSEALHPGAGLSEDEARRIGEEVMRTLKIRKTKACADGQ